MTQRKSDVFWRRLGEPLLERWNKAFLAPIWCVVVTVQVRMGGFILKGQGQLIYIFFAPINKLFNGRKDE
jgi:hypothetical protein